MSIYAELFTKKHNGIVRNPLFWVNILLIAVFTFFYYYIQFYWIPVSSKFPLARDFVTWEYQNNLFGSLFYFPLLYSIFFFWWKGSLVIWCLTITATMPRLLYFYSGNLSNIFNNLFYLSIPVLVLAFVNIELELRRRERKIAQEKEKERQNYLVQVFKAQEDERKRISQEIHDDSLQRLAVIASDAELLTDFQTLENIPIPLISQRIDSIKEAIISVSKDLRRLSLDLRPAILDDLGLVPALRWLVDGFKKESKIDVKLEILGSVKQASKIVSINLFRIVQESLSNIKRHSHATKVIVTIQYTDDMIKVMVRDNGKGFVIPKSNSDLSEKGKLGYIGMQQRAQFIGGDFTCQSEVDKGTFISVTLNASTTNEYADKAVYPAEK